MRKLPLLLASLVLAMVPVAHAIDCGEHATQGAMNQCATGQFLRADQDLNRVYNAYRARLDERQKRQLKEVQLAWIKFRDLSCRFDSSGVEGGSVYPLIFQSCLEMRTRERIKDLEVLSRCSDGELSCPPVKP